MTLKEIWSKARSKTSGWLSIHRGGESEDFKPVIDEDGLISSDVKPQQEAAEAADGDADSGSGAGEIKAIAAADKNESLERLQVGFDRLIEQLRGINDNFSRQATQHEELMVRIDKLPKLLESFPASAENQRQLTEQLMEHLKETATKNEQFLDTVERIPTEVAKQSGTLSDINHQLSAAAEADVQMAEGLNRFVQSLDKLDKTSSGHSDSIKQMSRTFAASDRYLKYILSRQRRTFVWVFVIAMGVCILSVVILAVIIVYLRQ